jgi:diacylglycerol kinase family enzyme
LTLLKHTDADIHAVSPAQLPAEARRIAADGAQRIGIAGGDGTMRAAAEALAGTAVTLAPLPTGTQNNFAHRVGIKDLTEGVRRLASDRSFPVEVGVVNDRLFLNTATFGMYGEVVRHRDRLARWLTRPPAAVIAFLHATLRLRRIAVEFDLPGTRLLRDTPLFGVRPARDNGAQPARRGWDSAPERSRPEAARPEPQAPAELEIAILNVRGRRDVAEFIVRNGARMLRGEIPSDDPRVEMFRTRFALVRARHDVDVTLDGEAFRWTPPFFIAPEKSALLVAADPG